ncbi:hypothetical protein GQ473_06985 [archaeon]|nr:hypothetical protein [archaeon]
MENKNINNLQDQKTQIQEYKRKCNECGKIWHSLISREKQIKKNAQDNNSQVCYNCCNADAQLQAKRNAESNESELDKLKKCPECSSSNYTEEVISCDKK